MKIWGKLLKLKLNKLWIIEVQKALQIRLIKRFSSPRRKSKDNLSSLCIKSSWWQRHAYVSSGVFAEWNSDKKLIHGVQPTNCGALWKCFLLVVCAVCKAVKIDDTNIDSCHDIEPCSKEIDVADGSFEKKIRNLNFNDRCFTWTLIEANCKTLSGAFELPVAT